MSGFEWYFALIALGLYGLVFGSFGNVVIYRLPLGMSLSHPPSTCPSCGSAIRWYDNMPLFGWIRLHGKCRDCDEPISGRYPLVELASGALWVLAGYAFDLSPRTAGAIIFFYILLLLTLVDIDTMRLPNSLVATLAGLGATLVLVSQFSNLDILPLTPTGNSLLSGPLATAVLGVLLGGGLSLGVALLYERVRGRSGFGMGDVKLLGAMGLYLGPFVLMALFFGSMGGAAYGILASRGKSEGLAA
ncbi:MAG: prepilin peptidase, partial [Actinomycetota bacterium]|nr:prepilin peptidase [Actinomycetota bacterium]